jgi:hypothetical protein
MSATFACRGRIARGGKSLGPIDCNKGKPLQQAYISRPALSRISIPPRKHIVDMPANQGKKIEAIEMDLKLLCHESCDRDIVRNLEF